MSKGTLPIPYVVALIIAIVVIVTLVYMYLTQTVIFYCTAKKAWCEGQRVEYCFQWKRMSEDYAEDKRPGDWNSFAPGCVDCGAGSPNSNDCKTG